MKRDDKWVYLIGLVCGLIIFAFSIYVGYQLGCNKRNAADVLIYQLGWNAGVVAGLKPEIDTREELNLMWVSDSLDFVEFVTFDE